MPLMVTINMRQTIQVLKNTLVFLVVGLLCWQVCFAQVDPWERVKLIEQGKNVHVKLHWGETVKGALDGWSREGLTIQRSRLGTPTGVVRIARSDITEVSQRGMSRAEKAMIALAATGGIFAVYLYMQTQKEYKTENERTFRKALIVIPVVGGIIAGIAALFPQHKEVIYTAAASAPGDPARR